MTAYAFDNAAQSVTASTVASNATSVTLSATSLFDASGKQYIVRADDSGSTAYMYCLVTANNTATNVLTWTEGVDGTSAIALGNASTVTEVITKKTINDTMVRLDVGASQTLTGPLVIPRTAGGTTAATSYGSMMIKLDEKSGDGTTNGISFTSIPTAFRTLILECFLRGTVTATNANLQMQLNSDTTAVYDWERANGAGGAWGLTGASGDTSMTLGYIAGSTAPANGCSHARIAIAFANSTTFDKACSSSGSLATAYTANNTNIMEASGFWHNATPAAVTTIKLIASAGFFTTSTLVTLYGIP